MRATATTRRPGNGPRLQPPRLTEQQFALYIRAPRTRQMPAYSTKVLSDAEAADIYRLHRLAAAGARRQGRAAAAALPVQHEPDPFNGTWVLNVAKSKMQPATASKSEIIHYRITGDEEDFLSDAVTIEGYPESIKYTARYDDGKAYPFSITINGKVTNPGASTMVKKIDAWTRERYNIRDGKPVIASRRVVSKDGKTMTLTILRVDAQGRETVNEVRLLEKQ